MDFSLSAELLEATRLTKAGRLTEATSALQRMLGTGSPVARPLGGSPVARPVGHGVVDSQEVIQPKLAPPDKQMFSAGESSAFRINNKPTNLAIAGPLRGFIDQIRHRGLPSGLGRRAPNPIHTDLPNGAEFLACTFRNQAGSRP